MKILLTGADGFLGRVTSALLRSKGHGVVTTDRHGSVDHVGDLADAAFVAGLPDVDCVVHAAAVQYVSGDLPIFGREAYFDRNNVQATAQLCKRYGPGGTFFVNVATSMMYWQGGTGPIAITSPMEAQGVYSRSKLAAQRQVEESFAEWATVIPCIIGGPGRGGLFKGFVGSIQKSGAAWVPGPGSHPTHMVHVDDVAALIGTVIERGARGFFNAAAPRPLSIVQWVHEIASELGVAGVRVRNLPLGPVTAAAKASRYRLLAREQVLMLTYPHVLDAAGSHAIGWNPAHDNARIVRDTARDIVAAGASASR